MRIIIVVLAGLLAAGCSTPAEIAATAPAHSELAATGVDDLSSCVLRDLTGLMAGAGVSLRRRIDEKTATIDAGALTPDFTLFQMHFAPAGGQTMVTTRMLKSIWGDYALLDDVLPVIRQCDAQGSVTTARK
jgi:hypothetical protein